MSTNTAMEMFVTFVQGALLINIRVNKAKSLIFLFGINCVGY